MRCCGKCPFILLGAALAAVLVIGGCSKDKDKEVAKTEAKEVKGGGDKKGGDSVAPAGAAKEVVGKGTGTLKGKVTYVGDPPKDKDLRPQMEMQGDKDHCLKSDIKGDLQEQTWKIGPDKGVKNVVVWLRPIGQDKGSYFKLGDAEKVRKDVVTMDQPYCQFHPHVVGVYPSYFDGKKLVPTGETFKVVNSAPINHNTAWAGNDIFNKGENQIIKSKGEMTVDAKPSRSNKPGEDLVRIRCDLHKWMNAYAWIFDHPFFAVTKEDGTYEIKNVPTGVELEVVHWHESFDKPKAAKKTLNDGENTIDFQLGK